MSATPGVRPTGARARLFGFRAALLYWTLSFSLFPLAGLPWLGDWLEVAEYEVRLGIGAWVGATVLGLTDIPTGYTGSGDGLAFWIHTVTMLALALLGAGAWTALSKRTQHPRLGRWFEELVCLWLGVTLIGYGIAKVIPTQMPFPALARLLLPYGEASPMGVVWRFIGTSPAYSVAAGMAELIPGILLLFHRTRTAGALLGAFVMTNVVLLNFCFDVPVKLFSAHLLLGLVALLLLDRARLLGALLTSSALPPHARRDLFATPTAERRWLWARVALLALVLVTTVTQGIDRYHRYGNGRARPPLWGIHNVLEFKRNGTAVPPLMTDETRWRALVIDNALPMEFRGQTYPGFMTIVHMDGRQEHVPVQFDPEALKVRFLVRGASPEESLAKPPRGEMVFQKRDGATVLKGSFDDAQLEIALEERDLEKTMPVIGRGFHWVNDYPNNR